MKRKKKNKDNPRSHQLKEIHIPFGKDKPDEKVVRLAHKILTQTIWPANLNLEQMTDVLATVLKAIVLSNTEDTEPEDRSGMIEWIGQRLVGSLMTIDPNVGRSRAWIVSPQGRITAPVCFFWAGDVDEDDDEVRISIGTDLAELRAEVERFVAHMTEDGGIAPIVTEGVAGLAMTDPNWDGEEQIACGDPTCTAMHGDAHLLAAEEMFLWAKEQQMVPGQSLVAHRPN
jgi:hypothetical protein